MERIYGGRLSDALARFACKLLVSDYTIRYMHMRTPKPDGAMWCVLLAALLSSIGAHAAITDTKSLSKQQPVSTVADSQTSSRHQEATNEANRKASPYPENWTGPDLRADKSPAFGDMRNELRKNDQTAKPPAKNPSGAKDTTQASARSDGKASSSPPAAEVKAPSSPVRLRTGRLTYTGSASSVGPPVFSPVRLRTERLSYTGLGSESGPAPFTPVRMRTGTLTYTGSGKP